LTITASHGSVTANPAKAVYAEGEVVTLIPKPDTGYSFTSWSGDAYGKSLVLNLTMDSNKTIVVNFGPWTPPIGHPSPSFGIFESYRMYDNPANRNPSLTYTQNAEGGYYTHYVDNTHPTATDAGGNLGTKTTPRLTIPMNVPEGSVVEIYGGPYTTEVTGTVYTLDRRIPLVGFGAATRPVFFRGGDSNNMPTMGAAEMLARTVHIEGTYIIVENIEFLNGIRAWPYGFDGHRTHHICVRNCEFHRKEIAGSAAFHAGWPGGHQEYYQRPDLIHDVVFYNNHVFNLGYSNWDDWIGKGDPQDSYGALMQINTYAVWVIDNYFHHIDGDAVHLNHQGIDDATQFSATRTYIGRNVMHHCRENGIDTKVCYDTISSQNVIHSIRTAPGSDGSALVVQTEHETTGNPMQRRAWHLFNEIYDSDVGIRAQDVAEVYLIGNIIHDIITSTSLSDDPWSSGSAIGGWSTYDAHIFNNTIFNCDLGILNAANRSYTEVHMANNSISNLTGNFYAQFGKQPYQVFIGAGSGALPHCTAHHDLYFQNGEALAIRWGSTYSSIAAFQAGTGHGQGSIEADPLFVKPDGYNFRLSSASPGINAGTQYTNVQTGYARFTELYGIDIRKDIEGTIRPQGSAWDIGAYEYIVEAVSDLAASGVSQNSVALAWTVPGEEGITGQPASYDIRYADSAITEANWDVAIQTSGEPVPGEFGTQQSFAITGLDPGATYHFAMKVLDEVGRASVLSNVVSGTTASSGNHAPVFTPIGDRSVVENGTLSFVVSATDGDGDSLTYSASGLPAGAGFNPATRTFTWTPTDAQEGTHRPMFQVADGHVTVSETITITVLSGSNHPPVLAPIGGKNVNEGQTLTFSISATDVDGHAITYSATNLPDGAQFNAATRTFTWTPGFDQAGSHSATFAASDGQAQDSETVTITVGNVNRAPILASVGNQQVNENFSLSFSLGATDPDGDSVSYSATGLPSGANFANGVFSWIPSFTQAGTHTVTFIASDGTLSDTEQITVTVANVADQTAPAVGNLCPPSGAIQAPINPLIALTISDGGWGVDADTVTIQIDGQLVYSGDQAEYESVHGVCRRTGTQASYWYHFHPDRLYNHEQEVSVRVTAADKANNVMTPYSYEFVTEMRLFGRNERVGLANSSSDRAAVATDREGNLWVVWHAGQMDTRDIFARCRDHQANQWSAPDPFRLTSLGSDQCRPVVAVDAEDTVYVAWQDNRGGDWDVYLSWSTDGITWQPAVKVTDSQDNQTNPAIAVDGATPSAVYLAWEDDAAGNQEIYVASSTTRFAGGHVPIRVTSQAADQTGPVLAVGGDNTAYLLWTDQRSGSADVYGASSGSGWTNVPVVTGTGDQRDPAVAVSPDTSQLHVLWVDGAGGDLDVVYGTSVGLPAGPLSGTVLVDDETGADQFAPRIVAGRGAGGESHVYACWQDDRWVAEAGDSELYFVEIGSGAGTTNVLVGDDGGNSNQSEPALGFDGNGQPVIFWTDDRGALPQVYGACSMYFEPAALASAMVPYTTGGRVGEDPALIDDEADVSITIPSHACGCDLVFTVSQIRNVSRFTSPWLAGCEIGPSGTAFSSPATVTIPYNGPVSGRPVPYWYNAQTGTLSQQGISNVRAETLANGTSVVSFQTTHLTPFYLMDVTASSSGSSSGGGGCSLSRCPDDDIVEHLFPYAALALLLLTLRRRGARARDL
jgi:hypothetical protein